MSKKLLQTCVAIAWIITNPVLHAEHKCAEVTVNSSGGKYSYSYMTCRESFGEHSPENAGQYGVDDIARPGESEVAISKTVEPNTYIWIGRQNTTESSVKCLVKAGANIITCTADKDGKPICNGEDCTSIN
jgi:hypothetical protein